MTSQERAFQQRSRSPRFWTWVLVGCAAAVVASLSLAAALNMSGVADRCALKLANPTAHHSPHCRVTVLAGSADVAKILLGTLIPLIIGWFILNETAKRKAQDRTIALHEEFSGLMEVRSRVFDDLGPLQRRITSKHASFADLWRIVTFYERLFVLLEQGFLDEMLVMDLFGETFVRWHDVHLRDKLNATESDVVIRLKRMNVFFTSRASSDQLDRWRASARQSRETFDAERSLGLPLHRAFKARPPASP